MVCDGVTGPVISASFLGPGGRRTVQHDVPAIAQRPLRDGQLVVIRGDQPSPRSTVGHRLQDRVVSEQWIAGKVHLRDQPLDERGTEQREVDMRGTPSVHVVTPRIGARLDRGEAVSTLIVSQATSDTRETGIQRSGMLVTLVGVPSSSVGLPDLDELPAHRTSVTVQNPAADRDPLPQRLNTMLTREIAVEISDVGNAED